MYCSAANVVPRDSRTIQDIRFESLQPVKMLKNWKKGARVAFFGRGLAPPRG